MGIGDWAQSPIPNPQSPIPNPQSPIPNPHFSQCEIIKESYKNIKIQKNKNVKKFKKNKK